MFSLAQLATAAGVTVPTVRKHIKDGNLEAKKIPGFQGLRVTEAAARKWMSRNCSDKLKNLPRI